MEWSGGEDVGELLECVQKWNSAHSLLKSKLEGAAFLLEDTVALVEGNLPQHEHFLRWWEELQQ